MEQYPANSHAYKEKQKQRESEERKIEKVVSGTAKVKKKSEIRKFTDTFISEDASNVKSYILSDVIVPAAKKLISDIVRDGIDMILYGGTGRSSRSSGSKISYRDYYERGSDRRAISSNSRTRFDYNDILFETRGEAEAVLDSMGDVIERYNFVTVADMYDMADLTAPFTANKYGWTNIRNAEVVRGRDGYTIKLPKASAID